MSFPCPYCEKEIPRAGLKACPKCYQPVKQCANLECGQYSKKEAPLCVYCGTVFNDNISESTTQPTSSSYHAQSASDPFGVTSTEMPLVPGMEIGADLTDKEGKRYLVGEYINKGAWGAIYRGEDRKFKRPVAIKAIFTTATADKVALKRLEREARLGAVLTHPNVVHIYDFDVYMGVYFLVMELVDGGDLNSLRAERTNERFGLDDALPLLHDIANGLDYLHLKGIIHRDLKPSNLLWHPKEKCLKITDFGLSNTARESILLSGVKSQSISGTDPYMAPEIWDAADPSKAGDLYALGVIAYEMLKGNLPFRGPNFAEQHRNATVHAIQGLPTTVNNALKMILSKDPSTRYSFAKEFITSLEKPPYPVCPVCGKVEDVERFTCPDCGRENVCINHQGDLGVCGECEEKRYQQASKAAEEERIAEELRKEDEEQKKAEQARIAAENKRKEEEEERKRRTTPGYLTHGPIPDMKFAYIPAGSFMMGSPYSDESAWDSEKPQHKVVLDAFRMMTTPVTQAMWEKVMGENPSDFKGDSTRPVENVSWDDIQEFLKKLNAMDRGKDYRLPTEAEWEYACRAGTTTKYWSGNNKSDLDRVGWYNENNNLETHPVGRKPANPWGLYDMHGNAWEWCEDWFVEDFYFGSPDKNPRGPYFGENRVLRGGPGYYFLCRSAYRYWSPPSGRFHFFSFRIVCSAE